MVMSTPLPAHLGEAPEQAARRTIPFDYAFSYELRGQPDRTHQKTVTVSIEGPYTAVAIGYGLVPRPMPLTFGPGDQEDYPADGSTTKPDNPGSNGSTTPLERSRRSESTTSPARSRWLVQPGVIATITGGPPPVVAPAPGRPAPAPTNPVKQPKKFGDLTMGTVLHSFRRAIQRSPRFLRGEAGLEALFRNGFRVKPAVLERILLNEGDVNLTAETLEDLFEVVAAPPEQVPFLYALFDEGTGRAFQSEPILSVAGLGISNGDRPFRHFAKPILFAPQTTIRLEVTEKSEFEGNLFISLQGYKVLGGRGSPTDVSRQGPRRI